MFLSTNPKRAQAISFKRRGLNLAILPKTVAAQVYACPILGSNKLSHMIPVTFKRQFSVLAGP
jgi:hypothetical protein